MRTTAKILPLFLFFSSISYGQTAVSPSQIFHAHRLAVVQIFRPDGVYGVGFIVSADGLVVTANHVATTRESNFTNFAQGIKVEVADAAGRINLYPATPVAQDSENRVNYDTVLLKIQAHGLPYVRMGTLNEVSIGDRVTIIPFIPQWHRMMITGIVSKKESVKYADLGPRPVKVVLFQAPVRSGFSGSPIFSSSGYVVGIVNTKVFGISEALEAAQNNIANGSKMGTVIITGVNPLAVESELIRNLDEDLISGLGSGVAIDYAKEAQKSEAAANP